MSSIIMVLFSLVSYSVIMEFSSLTQKSFDSADDSKLQEFNNEMNETFTDVSEFAYSSVDKINDVNVDPSISEGIDLMSILGRTALNIIKLMVNAFEIPVKILSAVANVLGFGAFFNLVIYSILTALAVLLLLEILSVAVRYKID